MFRIELLTGRHDRTWFDCGEPSLNDWLARLALPHQTKNYSRTRVLVHSAVPTQILSYYTLLPHEAETVRMPSRGKLPQRFACVLLARLAVACMVQARGLGRLMVLDAIALTRATLEQAAGIGLLVDATDEQAAECYRGYGFEPFKDDPLRLFLRVDWP